MHSRLCSSGTASMKLMFKLGDVGFWMLLSLFSITFSQSLRRCDIWGQGGLEFNIIVCDKRVHIGACPHPNSAVSMKFFVGMNTLFVKTENNIVGFKQFFWAWHVANWSLSFSHHPYLRQGQRELSSVIYRELMIVSQGWAYSPISFSSLAVYILFFFLTVHSLIHQIMLLSMSTKIQKNKIRAYCILGMEQENMQIYFVLKSFSDHKRFERAGELWNCTS